MGVDWKAKYEAERATIHVMRACLQVLLTGARDFQAVGVLSEACEDWKKAQNAI